MSRSGCRQHHITLGGHEATSLHVIDRGRVPLRCWGNGVHGSALFLGRGTGARMRLATHLDVDRSADGAASAVVRQSAETRRQGKTGPP